MGVFFFACFRRVVFSVRDALPRFRELQHPDSTVLDLLNIQQGAIFQPGMQSQLCALHFLCSFARLCVTRRSLFQGILPMMAGFAAQQGSNFGGLALNAMTNGMSNGTAPASRTLQYQGHAPAQKVRNENVTCECSRAVSDGACRSQAEDPTNETFSLEWACAMTTRLTCTSGPCTLIVLVLVSRRCHGPG